MLFFLELIVLIFFSSLNLFGPFSLSLFSASALFLDFEQSWDRKIDEAFLTLELEELCLLASSDDYDDLTLWKFAKLLKDYKGVAFIYIVLTLVNVLWVVNYEKPVNVKRVSNEKNIVLNAAFMAVSENKIVCIEDPDIKHAVVAYGYVVLSNGEVWYKVNMGWRSDEGEKIVYYINPNTFKFFSIDIENNNGVDPIQSKIECRCNSDNIESNYIINEYATVHKMMETVTRKDYYYQNGDIYVREWCNICSAYHNDPSVYEEANMSYDNLKHDCNQAGCSYQSTLHNYQLVNYQTINGTNKCVIFAGKLISL